VYFPKFAERWKNGSSQRYEHPHVAEYHFRQQSGMSIDDEMEKGMEFVKMARYDPSGFLHDDSNEMFLR